MSSILPSDGPIGFENVAHVTGNTRATAIYPTVYRTGGSVRLRWSLRTDQWEPRAPGIYTG